MKFFAEGVSMLPTYKEGDILNAQCSGFEIILGEIVVLKSMHNKVFAHRVIALGKGLVVCKGDNFKYFDPPVRTNSIIGVIKNQNICKYANYNIDIKLMTDDFENVYQSGSYLE